MAKRTTDEWQALLDGTTPGPWGHYVPRGTDGHYDPVFGDVPGDEISLVKRPADWHLIAAAPEAVAEVVRLREELEALRRACIESAEVSERNAEVAHVPDVYVGVAETERDTADIITRILDGSES